MIAINLYDNSDVDDGVGADNDGNRGAGAAGNNWAVAAILRRRYKATVNAFFYTQRSGLSAYNDMLQRRHYNSRSQWT